MVFRNLQPGPRGLLSGLLCRPSAVSTSHAPSLRCRLSGAPAQAPSPLPSPLHAARRELSEPLLKQSVTRPGRGRALDGEVAH